METLMLNDLPLADTEVKRCSISFASISEFGRDAAVLIAFVSGNKDELSKPQWLSP